MVSEGGTEAVPGRALILEDLPDSQTWLRAALEEAFPGVQTEIVDCLADARARLDGVPADLALIDLHLPDGSGLDVLRDIRQRWPKCLCVISTMYSDDQHIFPALRAGAQGYLLKDMTQTQIALRLRGILSGDPPLSPVIARRLLQVFEPPVAREEADVLSPRERETLVLIAKGLRLAEVAEHLGVTRNTAASYIKSVYNKLEVTSRAEAALAAARMGLVSNQF